MWQKVLSPWQVLLWVMGRWDTKVLGHMPALMSAIALRVVAF